MWSSSHETDIDLFGQVDDRRGLAAGESGAAELVDREREHRFRGRRAVEQRVEPTVDRGGRTARELLVTDHPRELGEVRTARPAPTQVGHAERLQRAAQHRVALREHAARLPRP